MLMISLLVVAGLLAAVLIVASTRPDTFRLQRSIRINAAAERVFPLIADFHAWTAWSPWEELDPALKRTYGGAASGLGAIYEWEGNKQVGKGRMEITGVTAASRITIKLDFIAPFEAHNTAEFTLAAEGGATSVTWAMHGPSPYMMKVMGLFVSMDSMVGKDFEKGLAKLKAVAEK
jgi:hypothetical protein